MRTGRPGGSRCLPQLYGQDIILKVRPPDMHEVELLSEGGTLISFIWPAQTRSCWTSWQRKDNSVGNGCVPRIPAEDGCPTVQWRNIAGYHC